MWRERIEKAYQRIRSEIRKTPVEFSSSLSDLTGAKVYLKLENYQISGSFKIRGVLNKLLSLEKPDVERGLVACSTGNHGTAFAHAVNRWGHYGLLFLPSNISVAKLDTLKTYDIPLKFYGNDCVVTEKHARNYALKNDKILVHPYNDESVVAGQGTIALEALDQIETRPDTFIVPVGGGGLISGIGAYLRSIDPSIQIIGCQPTHSAVMFHCLQAGRIIEMESLPTLSDATAGGVEEGSITFELCRSHVDEIFLVAEDEIKEAVRLLIAHHQMIVEGAAALTLATLIREKDKFSNKVVVLVLTGKKISSKVLMDCLGC